MATADGLDELRERVLRDAPAPQWRTADDLARLSVEAFVSQRATDLVWKEPERPTRRVTTTSADAARISSIIDGRDLDEEPASVEGLLIGISRERRVALVVDTDGEAGAVQILRGGLKDADIDSLHTGSRVRVEVVEKPRVSAAGETSITRRASRVEVLSG